MRGRFGVWGGWRWRGVGALRGSRGEGEEGEVKLDGVEGFGDGVGERWEGWKGREARD